MVLGSTREGQSGAEIPPGKGSIWGTPLTLHVLQVPIVPIVISPYCDFFSSKEKRFTSGKGWTGIPMAEDRAGTGDEAPGGVHGMLRGGEVAGVEMARGNIWFSVGSSNTSLAFPSSPRDLHHPSPPQGGNAGPEPKGCPQTDRECLAGHGQGPG